MCTLRNLWVGAASLLLAVAGNPLPQADAQDKEPRPPAEEKPAGTKDAGPAERSDEWGPERDGLRTRLLPSQEKYAVGGAARFRLEMKNFGKMERKYDSQDVCVNDSIQVTDPDGKPVRYVGGSFQTGGGPVSIATGKTAVLFDGFDLTNQYCFVKVGRYTLKFRGQKYAPDAFGDMSESPIPPSGKTTVEMRPGKLPMSMQVPARLVAILPKGWDMSLNMRVSEVNAGKIAPPGWELGDGTYLSLVRNAIYKPDVLRVKVWAAEHRLVWTGKYRTGKMVEPGKTAIYLGKGADGHVYWIVPAKAEKEWPDIQAKVKAALQIVPLAARPAKSE